MNIAAYIARKVATAGNQSFSRLIIRIAIMAVALSMAVMVVSTALIAGFKTEISNKIFGFWGHVHITDSGATWSLLENFNYPISSEQDFYPQLEQAGPQPYTAIRTFWGREYASPAMTYGGIRHIQQFAVMPGLVKSYPKDDIIMEGLILKGIAKDFDWSFFDQYLLEGEPLHVTDTISTRILISQSTSRRLKIGLGDRLEFSFLKSESQQIFRNFTVGGIYKTGLEEYDKEFAIVDIQQIQSILGWRPNQIGGFEVLLEDIRDLEVLTEYIHYDVLPGNLYAESIRDKMSELFSWLDIQDYNEAIILGLMTLVAIINMMTALLILILERTNMIGILKALGQPNWSIRQIFLYYAAYIVLFGLLWGNLIGLGLCWLQDTFEFIRLDEQSYYLPVAPVHVNVWTMVLLNLGTLVITLIFLVLPSYLATRIDPVKSIRFK